jgi:ribonucleotide reductase alpha subunit
MLKITKRTVSLTKVYDVSVQGTHSFFANNLLVHNCEICLPTRTFERVEDDKGRIALCTLGSINWGSFRHPEDMKRACRVLVRSLSNVLDYQDFLSVQSRLSNNELRPLGVGVTNLAYWHAKRNLKYGEPDSLAEVKRWIEHQNYFLLEASNELAKERGACTEFHLTRYAQGIFPWELRAKGVNELTDFTPSAELDWESLRAKIIKWGMYSATTGAIAPVESCQKNTNLINTPEGLKTIYQIAEQAGINWNEIENSNAIGFIKLLKPIAIIGANGLLDQIEQLYYNGIVEVDELTFEDGSIMSFTPNHRLLVLRNNKKLWISVKDIKEDDEIIETYDFGDTEIPT